MSHLGLILWYRHPHISEMQLLNHLQANPDFDINQKIGENQRTLYMQLITHPSIQLNNPLLQVVLRRNPNPMVRDWVGQTADEILEQLIRVLEENHLEDTDPTMIVLREKLQFARDYKQRYLAPARNVLRYKAVSKNRLLTGTNERPALVEDVEGKITEFLSGEKGHLNEGIRKFREKRGLGGKRKTARRKTRKSWNK